MPGNNLPTFGNTQYAQQPQQTSGAFGFSRSLVSGPTTNTMNNWFKERSIQRNEYQ